MSHDFCRMAVFAAVIIAMSGQGVSGQVRARMPGKAVAAPQGSPANVQTNCVNAPAMPDIILNKLEVSNGASLTKPVPGQTYEITALIENRGQCETGSFKVQIIVHVFVQDKGAEDHVILDKLVQSIQPARDKNPEYTRVSVTYTLGPNYNTGYEFYATADPDNRVTEFIENNNGIERGNGINLEVRLRTN
jgi:hypothetical protein